MTNASYIPHYIIIIIHSHTILTIKYIVHTYNVVIIMYCIIYTMILSNTDHKCKLGQAAQACAHAMNKLNCTMLIARVHKRYATAYINSSVTALFENDIVKCRVLAW